ncbi:MAG: hypothetical protein IPK80_28265 [Nannocystis sp.]|nr:hypothetical protein [Nannocystis sp.]
MPGKLPGLTSTLPSKEKEIAYWAWADLARQEAHQSNEAQVDVSTKQWPLGQPRFDPT